MDSHTTQNSMLFLIGEVNFGESSSTFCLPASDGSRCRADRHGEKSNATPRTTYMVRPRKASFIDVIVRKVCCLTFGLFVQSMLLPMMANFRTFPHISAIFIFMGSISRPTTAFELSYPIFRQGMAGKPFRLRPCVNRCRCFKLAQSGG